MATATDLQTLAAADMKLVGRFTCRACKMYCGIDRFEVAGRRFPFGGRCSLFENVWKRRTRVAPMPDLVEQRAAILFGITKHIDKSPRHEPAERLLGSRTGVRSRKIFLEESFGYSLRLRG